MTANNELITRLDDVLHGAVTRLEATPFMTELMSGSNARALYVAYLREAYHYVRLTSSFTPLSARRMDPELLELRKWILDHSGHEMGHELMALDDLEKLGYSRAEVKASEPLAGTWAWVSFFHYQVSVCPPFAAMGVLYFLEGMAASLAPKVGAQLANALVGDERAATSFIREHGELDLAHTAEQRDQLARFCTERADQDTVAETIVLAGQIKRFMLDSVVESVRGSAA